MPKVLRIINRLNLGGPTFNASYLSKYMAPEFETMLVSGMKDDSEESSEFIPRELGLEPVYIPEMKRELNFASDRAAFKSIKKIIQDFKPDIVHTHAAKAGAVGRLAASACNVPVIVHTFHGHVFHSYFSALKSKMYVQIERYLARKSSGIIAISQKQKEELGQVFKVCPMEKIEVIPLGFDLTRFNTDTERKRAQFRARYNLQEEEIAIGIVGRLVPVKNHELFLQAVQYVLEKTTQKVRAFIVGDGEDRHKLEARARELGLDFIDGNADCRKAAVTFTSWIKEIDLVYAGLDIVALTSLNEGTPVSLIEAQASGKPIVSTNVGGIENIVLPGTTSLLSENEDTATFCKHLLMLVEDQKLRLQMSTHGWDHVREKYHYQRLIDDMARYYWKLLNSR